MVEQLENLTDQDIIKIFSDRRKIANLIELFYLFSDPESSLAYNRFFNRVLTIKNSSPNWNYHRQRVNIWHTNINNWCNYFKMIAFLYPAEEIHLQATYIIEVFDFNQLVDIYWFYYRAKIFHKDLCQIYRIRMAAELQNERIDYYISDDDISSIVTQIVNNNTECIFDFCERQAIQVVNNLSGVK